MAKSNPDLSTFPKPSDDTPSNLILRANQFLKNDDMEHAYPLLCLLADKEKTNLQYAITTGLVALKLKRLNESIKYFQQAVAISPKDFDANYNLALLHIQTTDFIKAETILRHLIDNYPDSADLQNDLGVVLVKQNELNLARECFRMALRMDPGMIAAHDNLADLDQLSVVQSQKPAPATESHKSTTIVNDNQNEVCKNEISDGPIIEGKKIAFFANHVTFLKDIMARVGKKNEIKLIDGRSIDRIRETMEWADLAWFEWCDELMIRGANLPRTCPVICRLHSYEAFTDMPAQVDWRKVDYLVFVNQSVQEIFERQIQCATPRTVIHNGVDTLRFNLPENKPRSKKIASVGYINSKKNPTLLLYCFKKIHEYDREFSLHIAGQFQDPVLELYFQHFLRQNQLPVHFDGWVQNMPGWYADKDYVISTSLFESFHYSIAEGIASGLVPLIHNWFGADYLYPTEFMFNDPDDCLALVQRMERKDRSGLVLENRQFIENRYGSEKAIDKILRLMGQVVETVSDAPKMQTGTL